MVTTLTTGTESKDQSIEPSYINPQQEKIYARFFAAAVLGLIIGGIQGIIQRLPEVSDWLYAAGYGGHMVTNLAQTHIIMVGAGTISLTALIYYVLPRILHRPLYSNTLTNISFWFTTIGVYSFYFVLLTLGIVEGGLVRNGINYFYARDVILGPWHTIPLAIVAATMGIGYWTFVANVYLTMKTSKTWKGENAWIAKFMFLGTTGLFIGTLQGVYQVMPWTLNWLEQTGEIGQQVDPIAHAHINMVCGVCITLMGFIYYFLPRILGRPIFSKKLANFSFWTLAIGVLGFWASLISLSVYEGNWMIANHVTSVQLAIQHGEPWHDILRGGFGAIMGLGFWSWITNVVLTLTTNKDARYVDKADKWVVTFILATTFALLVGTIQGVIQILPFAQTWLMSTGQAGDLITPTAHSQLNIIAGVGFGIMGLVMYVLPKIVGRPMRSLTLTRVTFWCVLTGIAGFYISLLTLGFLESSQFLAGMTFTEARNHFGLLDPVLLSSFNVIIAVGYIAYAINIWLTVGKQETVDYMALQMNKAGASIDRMLDVYPKAMSKSSGQLAMNAAIALVLETIGGTIFFLGLGWVRSGRPTLGFWLFIIWFSLLSLIYGIFLTQNGPNFGLLFTLMVPIQIAISLVSGIFAAATYKQRGLKQTL